MSDPISRLNINHSLIKQVFSIYFIVYIVNIIVLFLLFPQYSVGADVVVVNFLFMGISVLFSSFCLHNFEEYDTRSFSNLLSLYCVLFCGSYIILHYTMSYMFTPDNFPFALSMPDQMKYWKWGEKVCDFMNGVTDSMKLRLHFSDKGFVFWVGTLFFLLGKSNIVINVMNVIFTVISVRLLVEAVHNISQDETLAKLSGLLYAFLPTTGYMTGCFLKESTMIFLLIWWLYNLTKLSRNISLTNIVVMLIVIFFLFSFRTFLGVFAVFFSLVYISKNSFKRLVVVLVLGAVFFVFYNSGVLGTRGEVESGMNGLQNQSMYQQNNSLSIAESVGGVGVLFPLSPIMPIPSMTDFRSGEDPERIGLLFRIHMEIIRIILCFFFYMGIYSITRNRDKSMLFLCLCCLLILFVNTQVGVLTYWRYQAPALIFIIPISAYGLLSMGNVKNQHWLFMTYTVLVTIMILIYNIYRVDKFA